LNLTEQQFTDPIYKILFESIEEGFIIVDQSGTILLSNPRTCELFGYEIGTIIGTKVEDLIPANLRQNHTKIRTDFHQSPKKRSMGAGINLKALRKDGSTFYVEISLNHVKVEGVTYVSALITDISERVAHEKEIQELNSDLEEKVKLRTKEVRESQELYSAIARNFPNGTINVFDRDLNYIFVEGKELFQLGITSENLIGTNYLEKISEEIRPKIKLALMTVFSGEAQDFEIDFKGQNYRINAVPLSFNSNQIDRILVVEKNITEQKQIAIQQNEALEKERSLNEMKSRFVSMASHEFRTPLSTVLSSTSLIQKYIEKERYDKIAKHTGRIKKSVRGLTEILNDFLSVDKLATQITPVRLLPFDYEQLSKDMVEEMETIAKEGQVIQRELSGDNFTINSDPNIIKNILYNLISNAIKYSGENKPILYRSEISENQLHILVRDHGIGIPKQDQAQLFTRFFRAKNVTNIKGTGLGLNIVKKYLEMLNGTLTFESEENQETSFNITIPINQ
jgi:PAS domain S-box-containing protein